MSVAQAPAQLIVRSTRVVLPGGVRPSALHILDGRIVKISNRDARASGVREIDAGDLVVFPGLVDTHVHINDPGRADWEGFDHATRAAAAGGVTTLIDMPLNSIPPTTSVEGFEAKLRAAADRCWVDVGFWGGVVPGNVADLEPLVARGVLGFKCFLAPSGVDEFQHVGEEDLRNALPILARLKVPLLAHAELPARLREPDRRSDPREFGTWLLSRPPESELAAIELLIRVARDTGAHVHIVHLASANTLPALQEARNAGVRVTVETCPHYLTFAAEGIPRGATAFKCAPPIREGHHGRRLWLALVAEQIDLVATDHSPAPPAMKALEDGDFLRAWGGIASLQVGLAAVWTGAARRGLSFEQLARWMADAPARLAGIGHIKGAIAEGHDADLVIWDPDASATIDATALYHRHPVTPYDGMRLRGVVRTTLLRGVTVFDEGRVLGSPGGRVLLGRTAGARIAR